MSETKAKPERTLQDIQQEYNGLCNKAGHLQYQIFTFKKDLDLVNSALRDLNFEAAALQANTAKKAAEEAQEKAAAEKSTNKPQEVSTSVN